MPELTPEILEKISEATSDDAWVRVSLQKERVPGEHSTVHPNLTPILKTLLADTWDEVHEEICALPHGCPAHENPYRS